MNSPRSTFRNMKQKNPLFLITRLFLTGLFCIFAYKLLTAVFAPWYRIDITLQTDQPQDVKVYHDSGLRTPPYHELYSYQESVVQANKIQTVSITHSPQALRSIRIDPGDKPGVMRLYKFTIYNSFNSKRVYNPAEMYELFSPNDHIGRYELKEDHLLVVATGDDAFLTGPVTTPPRYSSYIYLLSFLFSSFFFFLFSGVTTGFISKLRSLPAFVDIDQKGPAEGTNYQALDGLRGIGALYVLGEHATKPLDGLGGLGVCIFFTLSGFLLMQPFLKDSSRILAPAYMTGFFQRRIKRILPMYAFYLFLVYFISFRFDTFLRHLFFLQGDKHLWTMPQEMFFYLLLPPLLLAFHGMKKIHTLAAAALFISLIALANSGVFEVHIVHNDTCSMDIARNISIFLCGMFGALVLSSYLTRCTFTELQNRVFGICGAALLIFFTLLAAGVFNTRIHALSYPFSFNLLAVSLILCAMLSPGTYFNRFLACRPLRAIGLVSFSFYIVHYLTIKLVNQFFHHYTGGEMNEFALMLIAGTLSYAISIFTYSYIEKPFLSHKPVGTPDRRRISD